MTLAIYHGIVYQVGDDLNECLLLDRATGKEAQRVDFGDAMLVVDPTDRQIDDARPFTPSTDPLEDQCAICGDHIGYGVLFLHLKNCGAHGDDDES